jgi:hypothetical protein
LRKPKEKLKHCGRHSYKPKLSLKLRQNHRRDSEPRHKPRHRDKPRHWQTLRHRDKPKHELKHRHKPRHRDKPRHRHKQEHRLKRKRLKPGTKVPVIQIYEARIRILNHLRMEEETEREREQDHRSQRI